MEDAILVVNAGSSSIKFSVFIVRKGDLEPGIRGQVEGIYTSPRFIARQPDGTVLADHSWPEGDFLGHETALDHLVGFLHSKFKDAHLIGVGHRVVHGGPDFTQPLRVTPDIVTSLERLIPLAPLHQPHNIAPIRHLIESSPDLFQVACFDTSFHRTNPELAQRFALPEDLYTEGVRRYGFHGLSYEYIASVLEQFDARAAAGKCVVMHLGNGASMAAIEAGRSVASTMGFTAVEGLPMGTRSGSVDPGVILYLLNHRGMDARGIEKLLYHQSGLLGISGISSDMRTLLASSAPRARLAVDLYCYRIRRELGSLSAAMGGLDAIAFTGGIGENSVEIRSRVCRDSAWLGLKLDAIANAAGGPRITTADSKVAAWVIPTNEELMIARHTCLLLQST